MRLENDGYTENENNDPDWVMYTESGKRKSSERVIAERKQRVSLKKRERGRAREEVGQGRTKCGCPNAGRARR